MTAKKQILFAGVALLTTLVGGAASAQSLKGGLNQSADQTPSNFRRDRNVSVSERQHPGYEALGISAGGFMVWPKITLNTEYNDNIFATNADKVADGVSHIAPEVDVTSNWSRHSLQAYARGVFNQYWQNSNQNTNDFSVGARGRIDVQRDAQINLGADQSRLTEPRTSSASQGNPFPTQYDLTSVYAAGSKELNRLRVSGRVDWQHFDYLNRTGNFPQDDRNRNVTTLMGRVDYAVSPDTALFVEVAGNKRDYRLSSSPIVNGVPTFPDFVNRDSSGVQVLGGANFELGATARGEFGLGYLKQTFKDSQFSDVGGLGARAQVEWFPTQLTTVTFTGTRSVEDAGIVGASSYTSSNIGLKADHELLRNVILTGNVGYGKDDYKGIDRNDKHVLAGLGGTYLLNRSVGVTLGYTFNKQKSEGTDASVRSGNYTINKVALSLTLQY